MFYNIFAGFGEPDWRDGPSREGSTMNGSTVGKRDHLPDTQWDLCMCTSQNIIPPKTLSDTDPVQNIWKRSFALFLMQFHFKPLQRFFNLPSSENSNVDERNAVEWIYLDVFALTVAPLTCNLTTYLKDSITLSILKPTFFKRFHPYIHNASVVRFVVY